MPKVSFRMASASHESVFGVQTSTARKKIIGQAHRGPVDHDAKQMLRTERNRCRHTVAWALGRFDSLRRSVPGSLPFARGGGDANCGWGNTRGNATAHLFPLRPALEATGSGCG